MIIGKYFVSYLEKFGISDKKLKINKITVDTREIEKDDVFIAIKGGNNYINEAFEKGASFVVYEDNKLYSKKENILQVNDSIKFLQEFASYYIKKINPLVIGVTGSNGKTTTKDVIFAAIGDRFRSIKTKGNLNNHIGLPVTIISAPENTELFVLEMGMSDLGEIDTLAKIAEPDYGVITNIGDSHLEYLKNRETVFKAKSEIIEHTKQRMIVNGDDDFLRKVDGLKIGFNSYNDIYASDVEYDENHMKLTVNTKDRKFGVKTNLIGKFNVYNILFGVAIAIELKIPIEDIKENLENIEITSMRYEKIEYKNDIYINDAYNASPISMKESIDVFSGIYNDRIKIVVIGDMLELGEKSKEFHEEIGSYIFDKNINKIFLYGQEMRSFYEKYKERGTIFYFDEKKDIQEELRKYNNKAVLLKASRGMKLEEIIKNFK